VKQAQGSVSKLILDFQVFEENAPFAF